MLSVTDMFYNDKQEPVMVYGQPGDRSRTQTRRGHLSRQDSRNFRSSASPPPSRSSHHASSWFGHRKSSQSPTRSRHHSYQSDYSDYRNSKYGRSPERSGISSWFSGGHSRRGSMSPPSSYHDSQSHTKYKEDYTGYPVETGYTAQDGYKHQYGRGGYGGHMYASSAPGYVSSDSYHGSHSAVIPRTYQSTYGGATAYSSDYAETVKLKVPLCCEACEERITSHMLGLEGVDSVTCDQVKQKVTVRGLASPSEILRRGKECFKQTRFW